MGHFASSFAQRIIELESAYSREKSLPLTEFPI
jgi:hypothetical protein